MIKFDCGRAPGLEKRVRRELEEVERTEEKVEDPQGRGLIRSSLPLQSEPGGGTPREGSPRREHVCLPICVSLTGDKISALHCFDPFVGHLQPSGETQPPTNS